MAVLIKLNERLGSLEKHQLKIKAQKKKK